MPEIPARLEVSALPGVKMVAAMTSVKDQDPAGANLSAKGSFQTASSATNNMPVTSVLVGRPNMFPPARRSPTAVPAARTATIISQ
jgi:hypothetical protein